MSGERPQDGVEAAGFERLLLRLHPSASRGRVGRDRRRGGREVFADVIEINQIGALVAELLLPPGSSTRGWPTIQGAPSPTAWTWEFAPKPARTA